MAITYVNTTEIESIASDLISLSNEYFKLYEMFGFSLEDFRKINKMSLEGAFLTDAEKIELLEKLK